MCVYYCHWCMQQRLYVNVMMTDPVIVALPSSSAYNAACVTLYKTKTLTDFICIQRHFVSPASFEYYYCVLCLDECTYMYMNIWVWTEMKKLIAKRKSSLWRDILLHFYCRNVWKNKLAIIFFFFYVFNDYLIL